MELIVTERDNEEFVIKGDYIFVYIEDFLFFDYEKTINYLSDHLIKHLIGNDKFFNTYNVGLEIRKDIYAYVSGRIDYEKLNQELKNINLPTFAIVAISTQIKWYFETYSKIKDSVKTVNRVMINCNENNILRALMMAEGIKDKAVILICDDMDRIDFLSIIEDFDIDKDIDANISIRFKGGTKAIDLYRLFLANKYLTKKAISEEKKHPGLDKMVHADYGIEGLQSQEDEFSSPNTLAALLGVDKIVKASVRRRTIRCGTKIFS